MVELLLEGLITDGLDSVERRVHARRMARFADKLGLRHDLVVEAPHMAREFGEIGTGRLTNLVSGQLDGRYVIAWERGTTVPSGEDHREHLQRHPAGHFIAVPLQRRRLGLVAHAWHPLLTADTCPWLEGGTRMHLTEATAERLFRATAVDHAFARALVDERALLIRPRRSWAVLGGWAVCLGPGGIRQRGKWGLHRELDFIRGIAARCDAL